MASISALIPVFEEAKVLVSRPGNQFMYSGWDDAAEVLKGEQAHIRHAGADAGSRAGDVAGLEAGIRNSASTQAVEGARDHLHRRIRASAPVPPKTPV